MEQETQAFRLQSVATEFNVKWSRIYEELEKAGLHPEKKAPTAKISSAAYDYVRQLFQKDRSEKEKATQIGISSRPEKEKRETAATVTAPPPPPPPPPPVMEEKPVEKVTLTTKSLDGLKVVSRVDLDQEEKPATGRRRTKKAAPEAESQPVQTPSSEAPAAEPPRSEPITEPPAAQQPEMISLKQTPLPGPKILGTVTLPVPDKVVRSKTAEPVDKTPKEPVKESPAIKRQRKRIYPGKGTPLQERLPLRTDRDKPRTPPITTNKEIPDEVLEKSVSDRIREIKLRISTPGKVKPKAKPRPSMPSGAVQADSLKAQSETSEANVLLVTEFVSPHELAELLNVPANEIIQKCLELGRIVSINQRLEADLIEFIAYDYGRKVQFISLEEKESMEEQEQQDDPALLQPRPPVVTIMGHVDHGKTSLLDFIRQTNVVAGEKGGITQHIGAYEVTLDNDKKLTFLDTPGHEAFTAMRARGAKLTDVAVIVIAADDGVMPQTREAISHAQAAEVPMIFAFNKMDKPGASADRIRQQLADMNILVEEWGGKYQTQEISAKTGAGVNELLEKILLEAELLNLKANPNKKAAGTVIEATKDRGKGYVANLLVQEGTLRIGDVLVAGAQFGRIKNMFNERGHRITEAGPSTPVQILGLEGLPQAGEKFKVYESEQKARELALKRQQILREQGLRTRKHITLEEIGRRRALGNFKELNVILKADFDGSLQALTDEILKLSKPEISIKIIHRAVGQINENDVNLALTSDAIIIGFQVRPSAQARKLAEKEKIDIRLYSVIYQAIEELQSAMEGMLEPSIVEKLMGVADVKQVFRIKKVGTVAGCQVTEGKIQRSNKVRLVRDGIVVFTGEMLALKRFKDDVREVLTGQECGISLKNFNDIKEGDIIEAFEQEEVRRKL